MKPLSLAAGFLFFLVEVTQAQRQRPCRANSTYLRNDKIGKYECICDPNEPRPWMIDCLKVREYGENCTRYWEVCNFSTASLDCIEGTCQCSENERWNTEKSACISDSFCRRQKGSNFYYDSTVPTCFARIDAVIDLEDSKNDFNFGCPPNSAPVTKSVVIYGRRQNETSCQCNAGWTAKDSYDAKGCIPMKLYGESCSIENGDPCDKLTFQSCLKEQVCGCETAFVTGNIWDPALRSCRVKVGGSCVTEPDPSGYCVHGASCLPQENSRYDRCKCQENFESANNDDGLCYKSHRQACANNSDCLPSNVCMDKVCGCPDPVLQIYDSGLKECRNLAGTQCSKDGNSLCTENAECKSGQCECEPGFVNPGNGICMEIKGHLENCLGGDCNTVQGLVCTSGKCVCISSALKFVEGKGCTAGLGSPCGLLTPLGNCGGNSRCSYFVQCEDSAYCKPGMEDETCNKLGVLCPDKCVIRNI